MFVFAGQPNVYSFTYLVFCKEQIHTCVHDGMRMGLSANVTLTLRIPVEFFCLDAWTSRVSVSHLFNYLKAREECGKCLAMCEQCRTYCRHLSIQ